MCAHGSAAAPAKKTKVVRRVGVTLILPKYVVGGAMFFGNMDTGFWDGHWLF